MRIPDPVLLLSIIAVGGNPIEGPLAAEAAESVIPLIHAHAHNDYEHARPLLDALDHGFCSVEADIWLVDGKLLVAHDRNRVKPERTLEALYLDPLRDRVKQNQGRVYHDGPPCSLLIDVKSDAEKTYVVLREVLRRYAGVLTEFNANEVKTKAITVVISGNRARETMASEKVRYAAYDGRLSDLDAPDSQHLVAWVSDNWRNHFHWLGNGPMPGNEQLKLKGIVERAHQRGRLVRFWNTPDKTDFWKELSDAGVDLLNTDDLAGLEKFLRGRIKPGGN
jgi:glycerophosphoryl diester phosphodiesterase